VDPTQSSAHISAFGTGAAPAKAKPINAPATTTSAIEEAKGVKRGRAEESEDDDDDEEAAMDVSDSE
jgi:U2 small nuclear ribonucleoprotein B''